MIFKKQSIAAGDREREKGGRAGGRGAGGGGRSPSNCMFIEKEDRYMMTITGVHKLRKDFSIIIFNKMTFYIFILIKIITLLFFI